MAGIKTEIEFDGKGGGYLRRQKFCPYMTGGTLCTVQADSQIGIDGICEIKLSKISAPHTRYLVSWLDRPIANHLGGVKWMDVQRHQVERISVKSTWVL
jgi:hypothetical protein